MNQMARKKKSDPLSSKALPKAPAGIQGVDEITGGGLPRGRSTLISGGAGSGKTLFGLEFLVRGATQFSEPGGKTGTTTLHDALTHHLQITRLNRKIVKEFATIGNCTALLDLLAP
jgi:hypothetical protein